MAFLRPRRPKPGRAMTAATAIVDLGRDSAWATWRFGNWDWQVEAWRLYDVVGELRFLAGWIGDSISQCRMYVTRIDETGEETGEIDDQKIAQLAAVPLGTGSQRDDNLRLLGIDLAVAGEGWVVGENGATNEPQNWFVISGTQIRREGGIVTVDRPIQFGGKVLTLTDGRDLLIRAWRPHPNMIIQSDSPTRSAIPILREIELLTKREFAELESRLVSAGVWFLPEDLDFPRGEDDPEGIEGFMALLQRIAATNIRDQANAGALVPIMATVPSSLLEYLDKFKDPTNFWSPVSSEILEMKERAIRRLGATFEVPSEILTGIGDANHWTSWAIGEEGIKRIRPYLATIADTLTRGFLIPTLTRNGVENPDSYAYAFDVSPLAARPNRHDEAVQLSDRYLLTDEATVAASAFAPEQMPTDEEKLKMLLFRSVAKDPTLLADPGVQEALGMRTKIAISAPAQPAPPAVESAPAEETSPGTPDTLDDGPSTDAPSPGSAAARHYELSVDPVPSLIEDRLRVLVAQGGEPVAAWEEPRQYAEERLTAARIIAKALALRALELAGGRLATRADREHRWADVPRHELHTRMGPLPDERISRALVGAFAHAQVLTAGVDVPAESLVYVVEGHVHDCLSRGLPLQDDVLFAAVERLWP